MSWLCRVFGTHHGAGPPGSLPPSVHVAHLAILLVIPFFLAFIVKLLIARRVTPIRNLEQRNAMYKASFGFVSDT
ncbi:MAG: hypothetical protein ACYDCC_04230 [Actinomycetota bacterium]